MILPQLIFSEFFRFERLLRRGANDHGFVHPSSGLRQSLRGLHLGGSEPLTEDFHGEVEQMRGILLYSWTVH